MSILLMSSLQSFIQLLGALVIFGFVLLITYLTSKWIGGFQKASSLNKNLQLVETIRVGNNKFISILAVGKKYFVVSVGKDEINFLTEIRPEDLKEIPVCDTKDLGLPVESFQEILSKIKNKHTSSK